MKNLIISNFIIILICCLICTQVACTKKDNATTEVKTYVPNFVLAKTNNELAVVHSNSSANIIRDTSQFEEAISNYNSPLLKLPKDVVAEFKKSMVVRQGIGIVSFKYAGIQKLLTYDEFAIVMSMFGLDVKQGFWGFSTDQNIIQKLQFANSSLKTNSYDDGGDDDDGDDLTKDHKNYACSVVEYHTCIKWQDYICLSGC